MQKEITFVVSGNADKKTSFYWFKKFCPEYSENCYYVLVYNPITRFWDIYKIED